MRVSAKDLVKQLPKRGGFQPDSARDNGIMFSTVKSTTGKAFYIFLRVGKELALKAGLEAGDDVNLEWDTETCEGWLQVVPAGEGWKLISANPKTDTPPLVLRITWRESKERPMPSIFEPSLCRIVSARGRGVHFKFPKGTSFGPLAVKREDEDDDELYEQHKELMEKEEKINKRRPRKAEPAPPPRRRSSDVVPEWRDERPYGRRRGDYD